ncbi:MAG: amidohydrolase family protein [Pseudomonadota bacterium]
MPLIDFHVHVGTRSHWTPWVMSYFERTNQFYTTNFVEEITPNQVREHLDDENVDMVVILAEYAPKTTGVVTNEFVADFSARTHGLIPFGSICLYDGPDPKDQFFHAVNELGCKGIKLLPTYAHFFPDDPRLWPVYEAAQDLGIPVAFHTGTSIFKGSRIRYGNPLLLDEIAEDFPNLTIVMCHAGRPFWYAEAEWMLRRHKNTLIDIAGIPPKQIPSIFPHIERLRDRFLFGSDWPGIRSIAAQAGLIRQLPLDAETIECILWKNSARVLGLDLGNR